MKELHPIQLHDVAVSRLSIVVSDHDNADEFDGEIDLALQLGTSEFRRDDRLFAVGLRATVKPSTAVAEDGEPAFRIEVELSGQFAVDYSKFNFEDLRRWSEVNAPLLLLPYVREQIYGLALRAGVRRMIIPLFVSKPGRKKSEDENK